VTATSENPLLNKCYQALVSHIFFSDIEWESTPDGNCCAHAGVCQAWSDFWGHILDKQQLTKQQLPRDFLNTVAVNPSYT